MGIIFSELFQSADSISYLSAGYSDPHHALLPRAFFLILYLALIYLPADERSFVVQPLVFLVDDLSSEQDSFLFDRLQQK